MPKKIYANFSGLGKSDRNLPEGQFYSGRDVDLYRDEGYIKPAFATTDITITGVELIQDVQVYLDNAVLIGTSKIYHISSVANDTVDTNFDGAGNNFKSVGSMTSNVKTVRFPIGSTMHIMGIYGTDIFKCAYTGASLVTDYLTGAGTLNESALAAGEKDAIEWNGKLWITNGRYVSTFESDETWTTQVFDLGVPFRAHRFFKSDNYLFIIARNDWTATVPPATVETTGMRIFKIDGSSATGAVSVIPLEDVSFVHAVRNIGGRIYMWANLASAGHSFGYFTGSGFQLIKTLKTDVSGTFTDLAAPYHQWGISTDKNGVLFGSNSKGIISHFNSTTGQFTTPYSPSVASGSKIGAVRSVQNGKIYAGYYDGTNNKFCKFASGNSANASWKAGYADFGQRVKVNYVKFYFKPLVSGDSLQVGLDVDYTNGSATSLGTITYTADGAVSSKKFVKPFTCHAFRPTIGWVAGGTAISKIVVDYNFISD